MFLWGVFNVEGWGNKERKRERSFVGFSCLIGWVLLARLFVLFKERMEGFVVG